MSPPSRRACPHPVGAAPRRAPFADRDAVEVAGIFQTLADPTRLKILALLAEGEACVHMVCAHLDMTQSAISHQLRLLRVAHLVRPRRVGRKIYYAIDDDHVQTLLREGLRHAGCAEGPALMLRRRRRLASRPRRGVR
jgi:DNA-binding transcriptional ArsR family regulator